jgi:hypothetical protein
MLLFLLSYRCGTPWQPGAPETRVVPTESAAYNEQLVEAAAAHPPVGGTFGPFGLVTRGRGGVVDTAGAVAFNSAAMQPFVGPFERSCFWWKVRPHVPVCAMEPCLTLCVCSASRLWRRQWWC